ncbi:ABC transporter substrate-binding protein [Nocardioides phosphati]|uniref:ABC transporter substrate-binding protein n=1 Tax=Nocardioides phosphati TaxID=1867775 RepID=A0ABQ2NE18_9ACTN|nr:MlaD family protein [Nocardioides phosphati]GGO91206.1 ABC transporter substrate-binding protein [Nocardioides phosphati]
MTGFRSTMIKVVVFAIICIIFFVMLYNTMSNVVEQDHRTWRANFTSASGLRSGDDVRVAGVKVGRVESVEVTPDNQARVTFDLVNDQKIYDSTRLKLRYQNLLGQRYLSLTAGANRGAELSPSKVIGAGMTDPGFDLTALLNGFKPLFDTIDPTEVNKFANNIIAVLQGQGPAVDSLLKSTTSTAKFLSERDKAFTEVLNNLTPVLQNLAAHSDDLDATVKQLTALMSGLAKERQTFGTSIDTLGGLFGTTSQLVKEIRPSVRSDVQALRTTSGILAQNRDRVVKGVVALGSVTGNLAQVGSYYSALNIYFCNLGIEAEGLPTGTIWIGGDGGPYSEVCK